MSKKDQKIYCELL